MSCALLRRGVGHGQTTGLGVVGAAAQQQHHTDEWNTPSPKALKTHESPSRLTANVTDLALLTLTQ